MPRKSKEQERKEKETARVAKWQTENTKKLCLIFNVTTNESDKKAFEWLQKQENKSGYIKSLILSDAKKSGK